MGTMKLGAERWGWEMDAEPLLPPAFLCFVLRSDHEKNGRGLQEARRGKDPPPCFSTFGHTPAHTLNLQLEDTAAGQKHLSLGTALTRSCLSDPFWHTVFTSLRSHSREFHGSLMICLKRSLPSACLQTGPVGSPISSEDQQGVIYN